MIPSCWGIFPRRRCHRPRPQKKSSLRRRRRRRPPRSSRFASSSSSSVSSSSSFPLPGGKAILKSIFQEKGEKNTYVLHGVHGYALCREIVREERVFRDPILLAAHHNVDLAGVFQLAVLGSVVVPKLFGKTACLTTNNFYLSLLVYFLRLGLVLRRRAGVLLD